ncbi:hypothetical protein WJX64_10015 [Leifsonia sp. YIM 134122]|uniref:Uncharacterized protein n=1 Tax=Leifsonia stereocauli TaxID=3134136 RepID=A0ABU9W4U4_9MICO
MDERFSIGAPPVSIGGAPPPDSASARTLRRHASAGSRVRLRPGAFAPADWWAEATSAQRLAARIAAVSRTRMHEPVFSHESAALLRVRMHRPRGARWGWAIAVDPALLRQQLLTAGLRLR